MARALAILVVVLIFTSMTAFGALALEPGDRAPAFALPGSDGKSYALSDFVGRRGVVLAWFPKAFTPG